jgi:hypothetical protein
MGIWRDERGGSGVVDKCPAGSWCVFDTQISAQY